MFSENEQQKKFLDEMEAERRLKLGRDLAKALYLPLCVEVLFLFGIWLWHYQYIQFFVVSVLLMPAPIVLMLQPVFAANGRSTLWATFFSNYLIFLILVVPVFCIPELSQAAATAYAIIFLVAGLLSGTRQLLFVAFVAALGFALNTLVGHRLADLWFLPLNDTVSSIMLIGLGMLVIYGSGVVFYFVLNGQEKLYRQVQLAKIESEQAKATAENANRAKSTFLANTSHELRTPLNAILGFSQIMARDTTLNSTHRESIEIINRNGEHLLGLINNVLDMAKIESGRILLQERHFDLYKLIESIGAMFRMRANSKGLSLTVEYASDVPAYIQMDDAKLRQVLINLLGNAIKFTTTGGIVLRVCSCETADYLHFEVEDTGPGISSGEIQSLFEPFSQTASGRQAGEGTGLGLPISRQFVHLMGGELTLESQPGKGSLFSFDVLFHRPDDTQPHQMLAVKPRVIGLAAGQPAYRLLIVEDQIDSRLLLVGLLSAVGLQLQTASNGQEAIAIWQTWQPHLILMDLRLPIMNGHEAIQKIRALPGGQETIIVALSASSFAEEREQMLAEGCHDFIRKPYREEEIFDVLSRHLKVRFLYENETPQHGQSLPLDFSDMPFAWLSQLQKAALEADAEKIQELAQEISQTHPTIAKEIIRLTNHFAYEAILAAIFPAKGLI